MSSTEVVHVTTKDITVVAAGQQGPQGPAGAGAASATYIASAALSGHKIVLLDGAHQAAYASNDNVLHLNQVLGLTTHAASAGASVEVARNIEVYEPSWNWTVGGAIYLGSNGGLIQSPPVSPAVFSLIVGFATAANRMFVSMGVPIILS